MINVFHIIFLMKKYLLLLFSFLTTSVFSQYSTSKIKTNFISSSKMIWNYQEDKWDFKPNNDIESFTTNWTFSVNSSNQGMVTNGTINYDILEYNYVDETTVLLRLYNVNVSREMHMVVLKKDGKFVISIFDYNQRIAYFFL